MQTLNLVGVGLIAGLWAAALAGGGVALGQSPPGFGGALQQETRLLEQFDLDGNGRLDREERRAARVYVNERETNRGPGRFGGGRGGFQRPGGIEEAAQPGRKIAPEDVKVYPGVDAYAPTVVRTFFLEFENADWEKELADFNNTDVEVPAKLVVDGEEYEEVGVHFRGQSSFMMVPEGRKRSLNLSLDWVRDKQALGGYRTFNLLNAHGDPTFMRGVLYLQIAREYIPAPKANFVRVVINEENWGIYVSVQQFNKDFLREWFGTTKGARWKVPGRPNGRAGLEYIGEDLAAYRRLYEIKSKDDPESWAALVELCRVLNQTPADELEAALEPMLDIDGVLWFLALENAMVNTDGYWTRASDYSIYMEPTGRFHILPYDVNESLGSGGGPSGFGPGGPRMMRGGPESEGGPGRRGGGRMARDFGPRGGGVQLDPLVAVEDPAKPLISRLLAVPELRRRYLGYVRELAERWLDWERLGPIAVEYQNLLAADVKEDTRKLDTYEAFRHGVAKVETAEGNGSIESFARERRAFLLEHPEIQALGRE